MTPTDSPPSICQSLRSARDRAVEALVRMVTLERASDLVQFAGGGTLVALGLAGMFLGLGPIGLALVFYGAAILLMNWEKYHRGGGGAPKSRTGKELSH